MNPEARPICRTCLGLIAPGKASFDVDEENGLVKNVNNIREMLMFCEPEMDLYIVDNPVVCESCLHTLVSSYNFKIKCLKVENNIRSFMLANKVGEGNSHVDLRDVLRFSVKNKIQKSNPGGNFKQMVDAYMSGKTVTKPKAANNTSSIVNIPAGITIFSVPKPSTKDDDVVVIIDDDNDKPVKVRKSSTEKKVQAPSDETIIVLDDEDGKKLNTRRSLRKRRKMTDIVKSMPASKKSKFLSRSRKFKSFKCSDVAKRKPTEELGILESVGLQAKDASTIAPIVNNLESDKVRTTQSTVETRRLIVDLPKMTFFECHFCSFASVDENDLNEHCNSEHSSAENKIFICKLCRFKTSTSWTFKRHCRPLHLEESATILKDWEMLTKYRCGLCKYVGSNVDQIESHQTVKHFKFVNGVYECPNCQKGFPNVDDLKTHCVASRHVFHTTVYECVLCNFQCSKETKIKRHNSWHVTPNLKCLLCPFSTLKPYRMTDHVEKFHSSENLSGMAFVDDADTNDEQNDYRITLDSFRGRRSEPVTAKRNSESHNGPSLSDILCMSLIEDAGDQDCVIVDPQTANSDDCFVVPNISADKPADDDDCVLIEPRIETIDLEAQENKEDTKNDSQEDDSVKTPSVEANEEQENVSELPNDLPDVNREIGAVMSGVSDDGVENCVNIVQTSVDSQPREGDTSILSSTDFEKPKSPLESRLGDSQEMDVDSSKTDQNLSQESAKTDRASENTEDELVRIMNQTDMIRSESFSSLGECGNENTSVVVANE